MIRPDVEEEVNQEHLAATRRDLHQLIADEVALLGGDSTKLAVGGASQGGCTAYDAALSYPETLAACVVSFGQIYSCTAVPDRRTDLPVFHFHGVEDTVIALSLAEKGWERLREARFGRLTLHAEPGLTHCLPSSREFDLLDRQLRDWGFW